MANELLEKLAELEHEQWVQWSKAIVLDEDISPARRKRWRSYWVPYSQLAESVKYQDRVWARKVIEIIQSFGHDI